MNTIEKPTEVTPDKKTPEAIAKENFDKVKAAIEAGEAGKKDLEDTKEWIKASRKKNLYKEIEGNDQVKNTLKKLGNIILQHKEEDAYKDLVTYYGRIGRKMPTDFSKADKFTLAAILQSGAIQCCSQRGILLYTLKNERERAVDADPREKTMTALVQIFNYKEKNGKLEKSDFVGGIPNAKFIEAMIDDISVIPEKKEEEKKEENKKSDDSYLKDIMGPWYSPAPEGANKNGTNKKENKTEKKQEKSKKKAEKKQEEQTGPEYLDIQDMTKLIVKLRQMTPGQEYRVDLNLDGKIGAEKTLIFTIDKTGKKTLVFAPDGIKGTRKPLQAELDVQINYGPVKTTLKKIQEMINKIPNAPKKPTTPNTPNKPTAPNVPNPRRPNPNAPINTPTPVPPFMPKAPQKPNTPNTPNKPAAPNVPNPRRPNPNAPINTPTPVPPFMPKAPTSNTPTTSVSNGLPADTSRSNYKGSYGKRSLAK